MGAKKVQRKVQCTCKIFGGKGNCLGFAPRSENFAFVPYRHSRLNFFAIRTNSLRSCRPSANPLNPYHKANALQGFFPYHIAK